MTDKVLTISISAYNVDKYLDSTLKSLCIDNIDDVEILVINDGSTDNTLQIAQKYEATYPSTVRVIDKKNGGYGTTIKTGLSLAKGKYFMVLDGDDWLDTKSLDILVTELKIRDEDMVFWNMLFVYPDGKTVYKPTFHSDMSKKTYTWDEIKNPFDVKIHEMAIKTDKYQKIDYSLGDFFYVDIEFDVFSILAAQSFVYFDMDLYMYRYGLAEQSVNPINMQKNYKMLEDISVRLCNIYEKEKDSLDDMKKKCMVSRIASLSFSTFMVALSFPSNRENKENLRNYINKIESEEIKKYIYKSKKIFAVYLTFPFLYSLLSRLYRKIKKQ